MKAPNNSINCWFVSESDIERAIQNKRPYQESVRAYAYFFRERNLNGSVIEGFIGHCNDPEEFHNQLQAGFTYISDYLEGKPVYLTFDQRTLYKITDLYPSKPLLFTLTRTEKLMINPEEIYQSLYNEQWSAIIEILYQNKKEIAAEPSLHHAALTFETVFLQKVNTYPLSDSEIREMLEKLYLLHFGKFYRLSDDNLRRLTIELAKRFPLKDAYNYAQKYPDDEFCKTLIARYQSENTEKPQRRAYIPINFNWIEIYNRLFELINSQGNTATYFSGPRFMDAVREVLPYAPTYTQYIQLRNEAGKSTSRKIFYYDVLMEEEPENRIAIIEKILAIVRPFEPIKSSAIDILLGRKDADQLQKSPIANEKVAVAEPLDRPIVFISYSWDSEQHKEWVLNLANRLLVDGVEVLLDRYALKPGRNLPHFVEQSIARANRILIIFTPNYKLKADNRTGGVGYEYSIMNAGLYENQTNNEKVIPVLREGEMRDSIPDFMHQFIHMDLRNNENFDISYNDLKREIFDEPEIRRP